jgi:hypothetical protein
MPTMHHLPVQHTNILTRESVTGKSGACHVSLQTDLCGQTWPLSHPFPIPSTPFYTTQAIAGQYSCMQPSSVQYLLNPFMQAASVSSHPSEYLNVTAQPPCPFPEVVASANDPASNGRAAATMLVSPPSSPPPEDLVDDLFDFDRLEAEPELTLPTGSEDVQDVDILLGMHAVPGSSEDLFKLLTHDPVSGGAVLTTHLHQRADPGHHTEASAIPFAHVERSASGDEGAELSSIDNLKSPYIRQGLASHAGNMGAVEGEDAELLQLDGHSGHSGQRFPGNCGQVVAMIKTDGQAPDSSAAVGI